MNVKELKERLDKYDDDQEIIVILYSAFGRSPIFGSIYEIDESHNFLPSVRIHVS